MPRMRGKTSNIPMKKSNGPVSKQPGFTDTVKQGVGIGAGAAVGNAAINGVINTMSNNNSDKSNSTYLNCKMILQNFHDCMYSHNNIEFCKPQLDMLNICISGKQPN